MPRYQWMPITDLRGGRNATDDPLSIGETQAVQMRNGDTFRTQFFRKRPGSTAPAIGAVFTGVISSLLPHTPDNNPSHAEVWGVDNAAPPIVGRMAGASTFAAATLTDNVAAGAGAKVRGASYNGKFFLAYDSAVDFLHVWDPNLAAPAVRRVGLAKPAAAPTVADTGAGFYFFAKRYYRQRYRTKHGSVVDAQSEPSASVTFTPSGTGSAARVTKAATITESETHWVIEGSSDNVTFFELSEMAIATTTYDDSADPRLYSAASPANPLSPVLGSYTRPTSAKYLLAAFNRLFMLGNYEGGPQSRLWFSPSKGTSDKADDERVPDTLTVRNWIDLDEGTGGDGTGLAGPLYGAVYIFKYSKIKKILPTGAPSPVFDVIDISPTRGAIDQECIAVGEDPQGRPCIYFMDPEVGPMICGAMPPTEIGQGIRDLWDTINLAASNRVGIVTDYPKLGQVWFWFATGASNDPNVLAVLSKKTGGWQVHDAGGLLRLARAAALLPRTLGATMSRNKVPYVAYAGGNNTLLRGDTTDTDDNGTTFQALVKTRPLVWNGGRIFRATAPWIVAKPAAGVVLTVTLDADFGRDARVSTIDLTPTAAEAAAGRVWRRADGLDVEGAKAMQLQIGDAAAAANTWQVDRVYVPVLREDEDP